ncbi:MAG: SRPBCC family protein [Spirochaetota bacterium]
MSRSVVTEIQIHAPLPVVWRELSDFDSFPEWSTFIREIRGSMVRGSRLEIALQPPAREMRVINPVVLKSEPLHEFRWLGGKGVGGILLSGEHFFLLRPLDRERTVFTHGETFRGLLLPLRWRSLNSETRRGCAAFNQALKERCESGQPEPESESPEPGASRPGSSRTARGGEP